MWVNYGEYACVRVSKCISVVFLFSGSEEEERERGGGGEGERARERERMLMCLSFWGERGRESRKRRKAQT